MMEEYIIDFLLPDHFLHSLLLQERYFILRNIELELVLQRKTAQLYVLSDKS